MWLRQKLATFRSWSWFVFGVSRGIKFWHLTLLIGPPGWGRQRWVAKHWQWERSDKDDVEKVENAVEGLGNL